MIADLVEGILVSAGQHGLGVGDRGTVLVKHVVAQPLRALDVFLGVREPDLERAEAAKTPYLRRYLRREMRRRMGCRLFGLRPTDGIAVRRPAGHELLRGDF